MFKNTSCIVRNPKSQLSRRRQAKRTRAIIEALEIRRLLSGYTFTLANQGSSTANGTYLQALINGTSTITGDGVTNHTVTLGDTLILPDGLSYQLGDGALQLPDLGAAATVTESGGVVNTGNYTPTFKGALGTYTAAPTVVLYGGGGSGAVGTATLGTGTASGQVVSINISNGGTGYTAAPAVALIGGAQTLTIESSGYSAGSLGSGRFIPATEIGDTAQITGPGVNGYIVETVLSDSYGHSGAAQNYTFDGIEVCPESATDYISSSIVRFGIGGPTQNYDQLVPTNFVLNQDYIHAGTPGETSDDLNTAALENSVDTGVQLNAEYVTVENCQISDIHSPSLECHGIGGWNTNGNFVINNNYIDATGEDIIFGGSNITIPYPGQPTNITITNNYFTKNIAWDPQAPQFAGVAMDVKNDLEIKTGINVTVSQNIFENVWVGADQRGEAINLSNIAQSSNNPWTVAADITITDNVIRNCEQVIEMAGGEGPNTSVNGYNPTQIAHDITFSNNLAYNIGGPEWGPWSNQWAIQIVSGVAPINNITIENNTIIADDGYGFVENGSANASVAANFLCINNVFDEGLDGLFGNGLGSDKDALSSNDFKALTMTNPGSGYTSAPTVTIAGGGATGTNVATATAVIWPAGSEYAGEILYIQITNVGSGYTAAPTISISGGGGAGATATAMTPVNGQLCSYDFNGNVIIGGISSNYPTGTTNSYPATQNATGFFDIAGDEYGLLSTSAYYTSGTGGNTPGVNMADIAPGGSTLWAPADSANSLQNYYKFDAGTGTTSADNGLGTHETATLSSSSLWTTAGYSNDGIALTGGSSGSVSVASFTADSSFTFSAWVKPTNFSASQYIASTANGVFSLSINTSGELVATGATGTVTATGTALTANQWALVAASFNGTTLNLYVNGAAVGSGSITTTAGTTTLYIGGNKGSVSSFNGTIDEVRYYSSALSGTMDVIGDTYLRNAGGSGYNSSTNGFAVSFSGGGGSGAAATAYAVNGQGAITSIILSNSGSGYTSSPTMSFTNGAGSGALDTAAMSVSPISYLYQQYGPKIEETYNGAVGTNVTLTTYALIPDENGTNAAYAWSCVSYPVGVTAPTSSNWDTEAPTVTLNGAGLYCFQVVVTNSRGQSASVELPLSVDAIASTNVASVSPASINITPLGTQTFTVNGTSIANLPVIDDQFGHPMPSSGWSWDIINSGTNAAGDGLITTPGGVYTAPNIATLPATLGAVVQLRYTTPDGVIYKESDADVIVVSSTGLPAAPSNLVATPGTSSIALTWTDPSNTSNVTGYHIWRSTDNSTWGTSAYATVTGATDSSYTDTAPGASGTLYYYEVTSYNSSGDSTTAAGMTCGVATVLAYEGFDYNTGNNFNGATGGLGWSSAGWTLSNTSDGTIVSGSLGYTTTAGASLTVSGNAVQISSQGAAIDATRTLSSSVGTVGTTLWAGFEFTGYHSGGGLIGTQLEIGSGTNLIQLGSLSGTLEAYITVGAKTAQATTGQTMVANTVYFLAMEVEYLSTGDIISVYLDPATLANSSGSLPTASGVVTLPSSEQLLATNLVELNVASTSLVVDMDEIRLGATYNSVAPDPLVPAGSSVAPAKNKTSFHGRRTSPFLTSKPSGKNTSSDVVTHAFKSNAYPFYPALSGGAWRWTSGQSSADNMLLANMAGDLGNSWAGLFN